MVNQNHLIIPYFKCLAVIKNIFIYTVHWKHSVQRFISLVKYTKKIHTYTTVVINPVVSQVKDISIRFGDGDCYHWLKSQARTAVDAMKQASEPWNHTLILRQEKKFVSALLIFTKNDAPQFHTKVVGKAIFRTYTKTATGNLWL